MHRRSGDGLVESKLRLSPTLHGLRRLQERRALTGEREAIADAAADGRDGRPRRSHRVIEKGVATARRALHDLNVDWSDRSLRDLESGLGR